MVKIIGAVLALALAAPALALDEWGEAYGYAMKYGGSKDPSERAQAAAKLAAGMDGKHDKQAAQLLLSILASECAREGQGGKKEEDVSGEVLQNCEDSLKKASMKEAVEMIITQAQKSPSPRVRFYLCRALGGVAGDEATNALIKLLSDEKADPKVVIGACDGLKEKGAEASLDVLLKTLKNKAAPWEGKLSAVEAVDKINKPEKSVDGLIEALASLGADHARLKLEIMKVLGKFVGVADPKTDDPGWWKTAWNDKKTGKDPAKDGGTTVEPTEFFGLKTKSTRIVFVLDRTGSMDDPCTFPDKPSDPKKPPVNPATATGNQKPDPNELAAADKAAGIKKKWDDRKVAKKIEGLKKEFINTIYNLDPRVHFAVVWYEGNPTPWKNELIPATWQNKLECINEIEKLSPSGPTNIWGGLETAYKLVEQPNRPDVVGIDKKGNYATVVKGADTFFLMTDGNHNTGKFVGNGNPPGPDQNAFIAEVKKVHALRRVIIHVIALGDQGAGGDPLTQNSLNFLKKIADETGGSFAHIGK